MGGKIIYNIIKKLVMQHGFVKGVSQAKKLGFKPSQIQKAFKKPDLHKINKNALRVSDKIGLQMPENANRLFATVKSTNPKLAKTYRANTSFSKGKTIKRGDANSLIEDSMEVSDWG